MEKPIKPMMVAREEFAEALASLINDSGLPPVVVQPLLERAAAEMQRLAQDQYRRDFVAYRDAVQAYEQAARGETPEEG